MDSAQTLVLRQGFAATSVDEVIAASASSKGAFFNHFPTKNDLGRALLNRYAAADVAILETFMARAEVLTDDPGEQVVAFVRFFEDIADEIVVEHQQSCLYASFAYDRQLTLDGSTHVINDAIVAWREAIRAKLAAAAERRPLAIDVDLDAMADHVFVTFEGAFILARATGENEHMRAQLRALRQFVEAVVGMPRAAARPARSRIGNA